MGIVKDYQAYLVEVEAAVDGINKMVMIDEPSELNHFINSLSRSQNCLMAGVLPAFGNNNPASGDEYLPKAFVELIVVEKVDVSATFQDGFIEAFDKTYLLADQVRLKLLEDHVQGCNIMRMLDPKSIQIVPFNRSQVKGWNVIFTFDIWN